MSLSVVIPTFNTSKLVIEAIESVLAQAIEPLEVIVVDDGSSDDTRTSVSRFRSPVRYIYKENGGVSTARNLGVAEARGEWIAFLDADDVWHPRKLELQFAALKQHPEIALLGTRMYSWPGTHQEYMEMSLDIEEIPLKEIIVHNTLATSTIIAKTEVLRKAGPFDLNLHGPEDHDLWIRVCRLSRVANLRIALTGYRYARPGSLSKNAARMEAGMRMILMKLDRDGLFRGQPLLRHKAWGFFRYSCGNMYYRAEQYRRAVEHLLLSLTGYPLPYSRAYIPFTLGRLRLLAAAMRRKKPKFDGT